MSRKDALLMDDKETLEELYANFCETINPSYCSKETMHLLAEQAIIFFRINGWRSPSECDACEGGL